MLAAQSTAPPGDVLLAAAYVEAGGPDDLPLAQAVERWHLKAAKLTADEREKYLYSAILRLHATEPESVEETTTNPDGAQIPCTYEIVDDSFARRAEGGRVRGEIAYASFLVQRARARTATHGQRRHGGRASHARRPGHRRSREARGGPDDDGPPTDEADPPLVLRDRPAVVA